MTKMAQLLSTVFGPLLNSKVSCFLKSFANTEHGVGGRKRAPFSAFFSRQHRHDSETGPKILRKVDAAAVGYNSNQENSELQFSGVSPNSSLYDFGSSDSDQFSYFSEDSSSCSSSDSGDCDCDYRDVSEISPRPEITVSKVSEVSPNCYDDTDSDCDYSDFSENSSRPETTALKDSEISPRSLFCDCCYYYSVESNVESAVSSATVTSEDSTCSEVPLLEANPLIRIYRPDASNRVSPLQDVEWTMEKILTASDCNAQDRLLLKDKLAEDHILPYLDEASREGLNTVGGLRVNVLDSDLGIQFELTLKKWASTQCYGLMDDWKTDFAMRRGLRLEDEVAFRWDEHRNQLQFAVLWRSVPLIYLSKFA